jgi:hypothetical protein
LNKIHLYFREPPETDRFFFGDRYLRAALRRLQRGKKVSGIRKVFDNLCLGFDRLGVAYDINLPFERIRRGEPVVVLGAGRYALEGYNQPNPVIAGIALMTHPAEWKTLFEDYPVAVYLQHSEWARKIYVPYYGEDRCRLWPAGIDTRVWQPRDPQRKTIDFLVYNKIRWEKEAYYAAVRNPILERLDAMGMSYREIVYGTYGETDYAALLEKSKALLFLCEHESQGFACCEAMAMNLPVFAWDQGRWLDPNRFQWDDPEVPASSVPFFEERCGMTFKDFSGFDRGLPLFCDRLAKQAFRPREYILENLTLEISAGRMLDMISETYDKNGGRC